MTLSNFCPQSALDLAARKRIFVQEAFDHIYLSLTFIWQLITFRVKPNLLTLLFSYFLSYFTFYTTAIPNFFQLFPVTMFSCSVGLCTCSFLCLEHLPTPYPSLLQRETPYSLGLISDFTSSRWFGEGKGTGMLDAEPLTHIRMLMNFTIAWAPLCNRFGGILDIYSTRSPRWLWCTPNFESQRFSSKLIRIKDN